MLIDCGTNMKSLDHSMKSRACDIKKIEIEYCNTVSIGRNFSSPRMDKGCPNDRLLPVLVS